MLPGNRISGLKIAAGRATWVDDGKGKGFYNFVNKNSFEWFLNPSQLADLEVDEQDLLDCIEQCEKQFGAPDVYRPAMGLFPDAGVTNIGATYRSKANDKVICVFTPTSYQPHYISAPIDAYFEWYFQDHPEMKPEENIEDFLAYYDSIAGANASETNKSPVVPSYEEASQRTLNYMGESERQIFLQKIWNFHKNVSPGFKDRLKADVLETWERVARVRKTLDAYEGRTNLSDLEEALAKRKLRKVAR